MKATVSAVRKFLCIPSLKIGSNNRGKQQNVAKYTRHSVLSTADLGHKCTEFIRFTNNSQ